MADKTVVANCANCGAPMQAEPGTGGLVCGHCGSSEQLTGITSFIDATGASERRCPTCQTALSNGRLDGRPLSFCQRCEGLLVEMGNFVAVIDAARAREEQSGTIPQRRQSPGDRTINCPSCQSPMLSHFYGGPGNLVIDTCERCHLNWLDPGELRRIARAARG
jgi:Zn-finger nucleic acid-binding protein